MKKGLIVFMVLCLFPTSVYGMTVSSRSACLMDTASGRVLFAKDKDTPRLIASITNIMTT